MIADIIVTSVILLIVGGAVAYIIKAKKSGKRCIGCPDSGSCSSSHCSGNCGSCNGCGNADDK
ncbi:MAG: FeoB-associated Cys-rich membrane protein [Clostridia bacterium]|nr:FeoB-associated Cys-rich membrane protein [Clostridia bacterium]